jgi:uncharacterized repeat protein (TIGR01451 family)
MGVVCKVQAQTLNCSKSVANITTVGDGTTASQGDVLQYTIITTNLSALNITSATVFDNIPAGVSYVTGSTTLNGVSAADVSGAMPFAITGGLVNSPSFGAGILAPNVSATITFRVKVTANGGSISNYANLQGIYNSVNFTQSTNTVFTNLTADAACSVVYQCTAITPPGSPADPLFYRFIKMLDKSNGEGGPILYDGENGPCYDAVSGAAIATQLMDYVAAIAYDKNTNRIYFVNNWATNPAQDLCYIDLNASPVCARRFTGYPLEPNVTHSINRMAFASDGFGYAVTMRGEDLIQFSVNTGTGLPVITQLGPLINDGNNGANDVLAEMGGDLFGDGSGKLYLIANSSKLYKINPTTRVTTFLGSINPSPASSSNSIAIDPAGNVYIGGSYQDVYKVNLATMGGTSITGGATSNVWTSGDYSSCGFPVLSPSLIANKTARNTRNGLPFIVSGDTVEYSIEVTNTGNINAAGVKLFDSVPSATTYIPNSTTMNGLTVPDISGVMPFAGAGGKFINSTSEQSGIVKPGVGNKVVVAFKAKTVNNPTYICNQSRITLLDVEGNTIFVNSDDPAQPGQTATCFLTDGVLALNSLTFSGSLTNNQSLLKWSLQEGENIASYELEYADVPNHFKATGKLVAQHKGNKLSEYQFADKVNTTADTRFYRLKILQKGGSYTYSGVVFLSLKQVGMQVYPNPFNKEINVQLQLKTAEPIQFRLVDFYGKEVYATAQQFTPGYHSISLTMPAGCRPGMYVLEVKGAAGRLLQQKMLKK